jgi:hypothetical protein
MPSFPAEVEVGVVVVDREEELLKVVPRRLLGQLLGLLSLMMRS